ncbi:hypothetical protein SS50377_28234 [Spironucleus salmonicida]|uniref:Uncharacterized protein n=1 Tax=Spironucleus salmonicida TaxID=348837 RepID=V6LXH0_9EUKA|nr:hypothetical protein SS50377_28234 [Spironucleus salmonicida]|eukprot:EST48416.1 Hypothetical protein SS50377_11364 [Spironucleus salmonicida]
MPNEVPSRLTLLSTKMKPQQLQYKSQVISDTNFIVHHHTFQKFLENDHNIQNLQLKQADGAPDLYIRAAIDALNSIQKIDPTACKVVRQVLDFFLTDSKIKPKELDQAVENLQQLQLIKTDLENALEDATYQLNFAKEETDIFKTKLVQSDEDLSLYQQKCHKLDRELTEAEKRIVYLENFLKTERKDGVFSRLRKNEAMYRQNDLIAKQIDLQTVLEKVKLKLKNEETKTQDLIIKNRDLLIEMDLIVQENEKIKADTKHVLIISEQQCNKLESQNGKQKYKIMQLNNEVQRMEEVIRKFKHQNQVLFNRISAGCENQNYKILSTHANSGDNRLNQFDIEEDMVQIGCQNQFIQTSYLRKKVNKNFEDILVDPELLDAGVFADLLIQDLSEVSEDDYCQILKIIETEVQTQLQNQEQEYYGKVDLELVKYLKKQQYIEDLTFQQILEEQTDRTEKSVIQIVDFLKTKACSIARITRHVNFEKSLIKKYRKYKFQYNMQSLQIEYLQKQVKCEEIQQVILNLDKILKHTLTQTKGQQIEGTYLENTLQQVEDMKKNLFGKLQEADQNELQYMKLLTQARTITGQIQQVIDVSNSKTSRNISQLDMNQFSYSETITEDSFDGPRSIIQVTKKLGIAKKQSYKPVKFQDFIKQVQPDLVLLKKKVDEGYSFSDDYEELITQVPKLNLMGQSLQKLQISSQIKLNSSRESMTLNSKAILGSSVKQKQSSRCKEKSGDPQLSTQVKSIKLVNQEIQTIQVSISQQVNSYNQSNNKQQNSDQLKQKQKHSAPEQSKKQVVTDKQTTQITQDQQLITTQLVGNRQKQQIQVKNLEVLQEPDYMVQQSNYIEQQSFEHMQIAMTDCSTQLFIDMSDKETQFNIILKNLDHENTPIVLLDQLQQTDQIILVNQDIQVIEETFEQNIITSEETQVVDQFISEVNQDNIISIGVQISQKCQMCKQYIIKQQESLNLINNKQHVINKLLEKADHEKPELATRSTSPLLLSQEHVEYSQFSSQYDSFKKTQSQKYLPHFNEEQFGIRKQIMRNVQKNTLTYLDSVNQTANLHTILEIGHKIIRNNHQIQIKLKEKEMVEELEQCNKIDDLSHQIIDERLKLKEKIEDNNIGVAQFIKLEVEKATEELQSLVLESLINKENSQETSSFNLQNQSKSRMNFSEIYQQSKQQNQYKALYPNQILQEGVHFYECDQVSSSDVLIKDLSDEIDLEQNDQHGTHGNEEKKDYTKKFMSTLRKQNKQKQNNSCMINETIEKDDLLKEVKKYYSQSVAKLEKYQQNDTQALSVQRKNIESLLKHINMQDLINISQIIITQSKQKQRQSILQQKNVQLTTQSYEVAGNKFISPYKAALVFRRQAVSRKSSTALSYCQQSEIINQEYNGPQVINVECPQELMINIDYVNIYDKIYQKQKLPTIITQRLGISTLKYSNLLEIKTIPQEKNNVYWVGMPYWGIDIINKMKNLFRFLTQKVYHPNDQANSNMQLKYTDYIQIPPDIQLKNIYWLIKFIRQFYYEVDSMYVMKIIQKDQKTTFFDVLIQFISEKYGIKELTSRFIWQLLVNIIFQYQQDDIDEGHKSEIFFFVLQISNIIKVDQYVFYKFCRALFSLDISNPMTSQFQELVKTHSCKRQEMIDKSKQIFQNDIAAHQLFSKQISCNVEEAITFLVLYNISELVKQQDSIKNIFQQFQENNFINQIKAFNILKKINPYLTMNSLKELVNEQEFSQELFINIYLNLVTQPQDSVIKQCKHLIKMVDNIVTENNIENIDDQRNTVLFWFSTQKYVKALILAKLLLKDVQQLALQKQ